MGLKDELIKKSQKNGFKAQPKQQRQVEEDKILQLDTASLYDEPSSQGNDNDIDLSYAIDGGISNGEIEEDFSIDDPMDGNGSGVPSHDIDDPDPAPHPVVQQDQGYQQYDNYPQQPYPQQMPPQQQYGCQQKQQFGSSGLYGYDNYPQQQNSYQQSNYYPQNQQNSFDTSYDEPVTNKRHSHRSYDVPTAPAPVPIPEPEPEPAEEVDDRTLEDKLLDLAKQTVLTDVIGKFKSNIITDNALQKLVTAYLDGTDWPFSNGQVVLISALDEIVSSDYRNDIYEDLTSDIIESVKSDLV